MLTHRSPSSVQRRTTPRGRSRGLSIIELLVGFAIGLFILSGAAAMFVSNINSSRQLLLEARINQDMRSAMDLITREIRRSAYWGNSLAGTLTAAGGSVASPNPYSAVATTGTTELGYQYSRDVTENNALDAGTEQFGFRLNTTNNSIQMNIGGTWQEVTNTATLSIPNSGLSITPTVTAIDIRASCAKTCTANCPTVTVRTYDIVLTGNAVSNDALTRTLRSQVRMRNDTVAGVCPT